MNKFYMAGKTRLFTIQCNVSGKVLEIDEEFEPMSHKEACTMISKMHTPNNWSVVEVATI